jgi:hypothetical protein
MVLFFEFVDDPFVPARFLPVAMSLVVRIDSLTEVSRIAKEKDAIIEASEIAGDVVQLTLHHVVGFSEATGDRNDIITPVDLCFVSGARFIHNVVSVDQETHP